MGSLRRGEKEIGNSSTGEGIKDEIRIKKEKEKVNKEGIPNI